MKDAQGQVYWQLCNRDDFIVGQDAVWDTRQQALSLTPRLAEPPVVTATLAQIRAATNAPVIAVDGFGTWARIVEEDATELVAGGVTEPEVTRMTFEPGTVVHDLAPSADGRLFIALSGPSGDRIILHDLLDRYDDIDLIEAGFAPDRVSVAGDGRAWAVDRAGSQVRWIDGTPLDRRVTIRDRAAYVFQPEVLNTDPPRLRAPDLVDLSGVPEILDIAGLADGRLAILSRVAGRRASTLFICTVSSLSPAYALEGVTGAFSIAPFGEDALALAMVGAENAVAIPVPQEGEAGPIPVSSARLPLRRGTGARLCRMSPGEAAHYPTRPTVRTPGQPARPVSRLVAPSRPEYARSSTIRTHLLEANAPGTVWHRLYVEAQIPQGCGMTLLLAAGDDAAALADLPTDALHPHRFGTTRTDAGPKGVWRDFDSEKPFVPSATGQPRRENRCGLFTVLAQASDGPVRRIRGRFLRVDIVLQGSGLATPRMHALRVWGPRTAWRDKYLPDYLSAEDGPLAEGSDFLDRYLGIFEGLLTPLEDQVAHSWRLTRPGSAPPDVLDWLAGWIGADLDQALSVTARRRLLANAIPMWRRRGTLPGLKRMLDIVTDGGVSCGEIVVFEAYHLRRTFATILGADLSDRRNPLIPWASPNGNSHLGPTFFLGSEEERAFFALFRPELLDDDLTTAEQRAAALEDLAEFFDQHAHRVTILLHGEMDEDRRSLIARVAERDVPAHVETEIFDGPGSMVLAISSLLAVDSRFAPPPPRNPLELGTSRIGQTFLTDTPSLDGRFEGGF